MHKQLFINGNVQNPSSETGKYKNSPVPCLGTRELSSPRPFCNLYLQRPQPSLGQLALLLQEKGQIVHPHEGVGVLGSQLGLAAFQGSVAKTFCLAARDGALR